MEFSRNSDKSLICSEKTLHAQRRFGTDVNGIWYGVILFLYEFWKALSNLSLLSLFSFLQMFLTVLLLMARRNARRALNNRKISNIQLKTLKTNQN